MEKQIIRENGLVGTLFTQNNQSKLPAIILVPGSDGRIPEQFAERLANHGYIVFALGYFGVENLPQYLENIHLEYFETAINWLRSKPYVKENSLGLMGYSRGGELVLLLGSIFPKLINSIIAYVPSSVICGGFPHPNKPAWVYKNKPLEPFLPGLMSADINLTEADDLKMAVDAHVISYHANTADDPYIIADLFLARNNDDILEKAAIKVENIECPLLLLSGADDKIWPCDLYCRLIIERLAQNNSNIVRQHINYENAGHGIAEPYEGSIYHPVGDFWCKLGGTPESNILASEKSWTEVLSFLDKTLNTKNFEVKNHVESKSV